jgi:hypothetical protein
MLNDWDETRDLVWDSIWKFNLGFSVGDKTMTKDWGEAEEQTRVSPEISVSYAVWDVSEGVARNSAYPVRDLVWGSVGVSVWDHIWDSFTKTF